MVANEIIVKIMVCQIFSLTYFEKANQSAFVSPTTLYNTFQFLTLKKTPVSKKIRVAVVRILVLCCVRRAYACCCWPAGGCC